MKPAENGNSFTLFNLHSDGFLVKVLLPVLLFVAGCSSLGEESDTRCSFWIDAYRGEPVQYEDILEDLANVHVIYLGERHTLRRHHAIQTQIIAELIKRKLPLAVAIEQMESFQQPILDNYNNKEINFDQLAEATDWSKRWRNFEQYRQILETANQSGVPILALNASKEAIRQIAQKGIDGLDPKTRKQLPSNINLDDPLYEKYLNRVMMVMAKVTPKRLPRMFEAQVARDETMAQVISSFLKTKQGKDRMVVVLCGAGHVCYGMGIPARVRRRLPFIKDRIILLTESGDVELSPAEKSMTREIDITHEQLRNLDKPIADYLHATNLKRNF